MRQDVKLGFAIGGVLLAVLIVYVLVVPGGSNQKKLAATGNGAVTSPDGGITLEPVKKDEKSTGAAAPATATPPTAVPVPPPLADKDAGKVDPFKNDEPEPQLRADAKTKNLDWNKLLNETPTMIGQTPQGKSAAGSGAGSETGTGAATNVLAPTTPVVQAVTASTGTSPTDTSPVIEPAVPAAPEANAPTTPAEPTVAGPTVEAATASKHTVKEGETYSSIAIASYGSSSFYPALMRANPSIDPQRLKPGMTINVPAKSQVKPNENAAVVAAAKVAPIIDATKEYRVQAGDSLHKISTRLYGNIGKADKIYQLNKQAIGDDPHRLKVGQVLQLPEPPAAKAALR